MSASTNIEQILILGATSGLGEAFARHFHGIGKSVIASGRRVERLNALKSELKGLETVQLDVVDFDNLEANLSSIIKSYPQLDSVFIMSGKMEYTDFKDSSTTSNAAITSEVNTNLIAPMIISRIMVPHLLSLAKSTTLITVSSGLGFIPRPWYATYCATKAGIHSFSVALRASLAGRNINVVELAPPYVDTELNASHRATTEALSGPIVVPPMPLEQYMETAVKGFETPSVKEIATGFSQIGVDAWRGAFDPVLKNVGVQGLSGTSNFLSARWSPL